MTQAIANDLRSLNVPHIDQYFGLWAIDEQRFRSAVDRVKGMDLHLHIKAKKQELQARGPRSDAGDFGTYQVTSNGIAVVDLSGPLMKYVSSLSGGTSTVAARQQLRLAANDKEVNAICLRIDSPGGTTSGTADLGAAIAQAAAQKPVYAYIEDMGASAAYWAACQAQKVFCNPTAMVGSIGTYAVICDSSQQAAADGVKVYVLSTGNFKGAGVDGTEITPDQLAEWQRMVNEMNAHFLSAVSQGRNMPMAQVEALADGRVHIGASAQTLGLVDGVQSFDDTLEQLSKLFQKNPTSDSPRRPSAMSATEVVTTQAATFKQIKAACPGADEKFICAARRRSLDRSGPKSLDDRAKRPHRGSQQGYRRRQGRGGCAGHRQPRQDRREQRGHARKPRSGLRRGFRGRNGPQQGQPRQGAASRRAEAPGLARGVSAGPQRRHRPQHEQDHGAAPLTPKTVYQPRKRNPTTTDQKP